MLRRLPLLQHQLHTSRLGKCRLQEVPEQHFALLLSYKKRHLSACRASSKMHEAGYAAPWMVPLQAALNHGGTKRPKRDRKGAGRKHVQLASVDPASGRPTVRTVAFRGFLTAAHLSEESRSVLDAAGHVLQQESCLPTFVTDARAAKVRQLQQPYNHFVECCWWLDEAAVQFRLAGRVVIATADSDDADLRAICRCVWQRLKRETKETFTWPCPGVPVSGSSAATDGPESAEGIAETQSIDDAADEGDTDGIPLSNASFAVLILVPDRVDELRLGGRQRRRIYSVPTEAGGLPVERSQSQVRQAAGQPGGVGLWEEATRLEWLMEEVNP